MDDLMTLKEFNIDYLQLVNSGVYGVFDEVNKRVFISCSNNLLKGIADVVTKIKNLDHVCSNMDSPEIKVLFLGPEPKLEGAKLIDKLSSVGYEILNQSSPIRLEAKIRTLKIDEEDKYYAVVTLRSSRGHERIVAAFEGMDECNEWFSENYPNGFVDKVVVLDCELTSKLQKTLS